MAKRNGWITTKGIIITALVVVLAFGLWGGIRLVQDRGEQARRDDSVNKAQERLDEIVAQSEKDAAKKAEEAKKAENDKKTDTATTATPQSTVAEMPQTGPSESMTAILVALAVFTGASYVASTRELRAIKARN